MEENHVYCEFDSVVVDVDVDAGGVLVLLLVDGGHHLDIREKMLPLHLVVYSISLFDAAALLPRYLFFDGHSPLLALPIVASSAMVASYFFEYISILLSSSSRNVGACSFLAVLRSTAIYLRNHEIQGVPRGLKSNLSML